MNRRLTAVSRGKGLWLACCSGPKPTCPWEFRSYNLAGTQIWGGIYLSGLSIAGEALRSIKELSEMPGIQNEDHTEIIPEILCVDFKGTGTDSQRVLSTNLLYHFFSKNKWRLIPYTLVSVKPLSPEGTKIKEKVNSQFSNRIQRTGQMLLPERKTFNRGIMWCMKFLSMEKTRRAVWKGPLLGETLL